MLLNELDGFFRGFGQVTPDVCRVEKARSFLAGKAARLDPRIGEEIGTVSGEEEVAANGRNLAILILRDDPECAEFGKMWDPRTLSRLRRY